MAKGDSSINNIRNLVDAFNEERADAIDLVVRGVSDQVLVEFLEVAHFDHRKHFIEMYINESILTDISTKIKEEVLEIIGFANYSALVAKLDVEDALITIQDFDDVLQQKILSRLPSNEAKEILKELLSYPVESAGRLIHKDFIIIPEHWSIAQSVDFLRLRKNIPKNQNQIFIVNKELQPIGTIELSDILFSKKDTKIRDKMNIALHLVTTDLDQEAVANIFRQYSLLSTAAVNESGQIVGLISADDIVDVIAKEAEEDILHLGGVSSTDVSNTFTETVFKRLPWLLITFLAINLTSVVIGLFEKVLLHSVELAMLMPIIAAMGGNAGVQASTIAVRALATKKLTHVNTLRLIMKELLLGFANGVIVSAFAILIIAIRFHSFKIEIIFSISMIIVFSAATFLGSAIPILLHRMGFDPALSSSVVTSSITDMIGFSILLGVASLLLSS